MSTLLFSDKVAEIFVSVDDFCNHFELNSKNKVQDIVVLPDLF